MIFLARNDALPAGERHASRIWTDHLANPCCKPQNEKLSRRRFVRLCSLYKKMKSKVSKSQKTGWDATLVETIQINLLCFTNSSQIRRKHMPRWMPWPKKSTLNGSDYDTLLAWTAFRCESFANKILKKNSRESCFGKVGFNPLFFPRTL